MGVAGVVERLQSLVHEASKSQGQVRMGFQVGREALVLQVPVEVEACKLSGQIRQGLLRCVSVQIG